MTRKQIALQEISASRQVIQRRKERMEETYKLDNEWNNSENK